jgi:segregation and condensation protein A
LSDEKPFWFKPPWLILFDIIRLQRLRPWDVNLSFLLNSFLNEMRKQGVVDFTASGTALLSSATIYRMKSDDILKMEDPPHPPDAKIIEALPPLIRLPYRHALSSTSVEELLKALDDALNMELSILREPVLKPLLPTPTIIEALDPFLVDIDSHLEGLFERLLSLFQEKKMILFSELSRSMERIEIVRTFIILLFLASRERLALWQDEEFGEIYISMPKLGGEASV